LPRDPAQPSTAAVGAPFSQGQILHLMKSEFGRARRHGHALACLALRLDGLLGLAGSAGGEFRDKLRQDLARLVDERTREHDHLGLIGDDGYLLVLPHTELEGALVVAERIMLAIRSTAVGAPGVTASVGVSATEGSDTLFFDTLLAQAEHARDRASTQGGDRIEAFRRERLPGGPDSRG